MTKPTTEELKDLLAKVTPAPWWTDAKYSGAENGCAIIAARTDCGPLPGNPTRGMVAWSRSLLNTEARRCEANATLIALAPTLADEVVRLRVVADAFKELLATVEGECPSLVDEDSGASQVLLNLLWDARQALSQKIIAHWRI